MNLRQAVLIAALANLSYFCIEFAMAWKIGSVSLFADSVDFLEDACVNVLVMAGLGWTAVNPLRRWLETSWARTETNRVAWQA